MVQSTSYMSDFVGKGEDEPSLQFPEDHREVVVHIISVKELADQVKFINSRRYRHVEPHTMICVLYKRREWHRNEYTSVSSWCNQPRTAILVQEWLKPKFSLLASHAAASVCASTVVAHVSLYSF